ncbi:unnamed protein product, partial [marine sediment metagenome]
DDGSEECTDTVRKKCVVVGDPPWEECDCTDEDGTTFVDCGTYNT